MSYIGNNLQVAYPSYRVIDDISSGFNGVLKTFALRVAGSTPIPFPINPQQCLLSVNNIIQKPDSTGASGFTLTGSNIVFATAPTAGWSFFGTVLAGADYVNVGANFPAGTAAVPSVNFDASTGTGLFLASSNVLGITTGGVQRLVVDSSGFVGIGTASPSGLFDARGFSYLSGAQIRDSSHVAKGYVQGDARGFLLATDGAVNIAFDVNGTERARIDSSGRLLVGTSSNDSNALAVIQGYVGLASGQGVLALRLGTTRPTSANTEIGSIRFESTSNTSSNYHYASISAFSDGASSSDTDIPGRLVFSTTADGAASPTERMRITQDGYLWVGTASGGSQHRFVNSAADGTTSLTIQGADEIARFAGVTSGANPSSTGTALWIRRNGTTSRSINAAGTVNASGADYAEYMIKAGNFNIAKGDVCGITADGLLTVNYSDAVSFVVKSTNPSYVGGDTWGTDEVIGPKPDENDAEALAQWETDLETARQQVDRIAFAGQVPVNVTGATPGQYIVPVEAADGGITGSAKDEADLTLAEYMRAVGKVIAIEDDGRARIIVKVA